VEDGEADKLWSLEFIFRPLRTRVLVLLSWYISDIASSDIASGQWFSTPKSHPRAI
jgi:hypothetical protein